MMTAPIKSPRKLIEVALPLDAINAAAAREKSIRHGHPSTLHLWWARRPLAAARAVLFAQLVNDPGYQQGGGFKYGMNQEAAAAERERLFGIMRELVLWENTTNEDVLDRARAEIRRSWREVCELNQDHPQAAELFNPDVLPAFHDPFAGGGAIPLEAQRLGLEAYASDLNPVAVLINKAMIEIPPKFAGMPPVNPEAREGKNGQGAIFAREWKGAQGLAEDVRYYGKWMRDEAEKRIGRLYPKVGITAEMAAERPDLLPLVGQELTVIAWLWARTVKSPNPAFSHVDVPLATTFTLSTQAGKEAYVDPVIDGYGYYFEVKVGKPPDADRISPGTKLARGANFKCLVSGTPISGDYIKAEGKAGRMGERLMAIVADRKQGRVYLSPTKEMEDKTRKARPEWRPDTLLPPDLRAFWTPLYGLETYGDLFTERQLATLSTFSDLVKDVREKVLHEVSVQPIDTAASPTSSIRSAQTYADDVATYLAIAVSKETVFLVTQARWRNGEGKSAPAFGRQALPMVWDYADLNPFAGAGGDFLGIVDGIAKTLCNSPYLVVGHVEQADAISQNISANKIVSTDPPYYDNIGYADLSDYFYVWLRQSLRSIYPGIFATLTTPKGAELVASPYRHGSKRKAEEFFLKGMTQALQRVASQAHDAFPVTIYYAFKQSESDDEGTSSTGWDTFLEAVIQAGFSISGTWPIRTESHTRLVGMVTNALASSIVLVCHKLSADAPTCSRRDFLRELNTVLPEALADMTRGSADGVSPVAPVDLSQAIIGPGMAVFSKYSAVLEANGEPMRVRTALQLINRFLAEDDFDADTQFCLHWFEQHGWAAGRFGEADTLARAKGTSVEGVRESGVIEAGGGSVRLRKWAEYPAGWQPGRDSRNPMWETLHHLIRSLKAGAGEGDAGALLGATRGQAEAVRQLAYRLYTLCERQGWAEDARAYNELITSWTAIEEAAATAPAAGADPLQSGLFD